MLSLIKRGRISPIETTCPEPGRDLGDGCPEVNGLAVAQGIYARQVEKIGIPLTPLEFVNLCKPLFLLSE